MTAPAEVSRSEVRPGAETVTYWRVWVNPKNGRRYEGFVTRTVTLRPCGTLAAYKRHLSRGEVPDGACVAVATKQSAESRARRVLRASEIAGRAVSVRAAARILRDAEHGQ